MCQEFCKLFAESITVILVLLRKNFRSKLRVNLPTVNLAATVSWGSLETEGKYWRKSISGPVIFIVRQRLNSSKSRVLNAYVTNFCFHLAAMKSVEEQNPTVTADCINGYYYRDCDSCIIITAWVASGDQHQSLEFSLNPHRTTVASSRAREGSCHCWQGSTILLGDMENFFKKVLRIF